MDLFDQEFFDNQFDIAIPDVQDRLEGTPGNDNLNAGSGLNTVIGKDGDDTLSSGSGLNTLAGEAGNDNLNAGSGRNTLTGGVGDDNLTTGSGQNILAGEAGNDILTSGSGQNSLSGDIGNDRLSTGSGLNQLDGGDNDDYLASVTGGTVSASPENPDQVISGNSLTGGSGQDTFFFSQADPSAGVDGSIVVVDGDIVNDNIESKKTIDKVADFNSSQGDQIQLDANSFKVAPGDNSTLQFDNNTGILSLAGEPAIEVVNGVDTDVLANTQIVEGGENNVIIADGITQGTDGDDVIISDDVAVGENGDDAENNDGTPNIYRFFEPNRGFHFYTSSTTERDTILEQIESGELSYTYEGESFAALAEDDDGDPLTGAKPVYRFFNDITGAHLYTISEKEKNNIVDSLPDYNLEGVAYYAYDAPQENTIPLYRLYNGDTGTHFFTPSAAEKDNALANLPGYSAEGEDAIAFHVLPTDL